MDTDLKGLEKDGQGADGEVFGPFQPLQVLGERTFSTTPARVPLSTARCCPTDALI